MSRSKDVRFAIAARLRTQSSRSPQRIEHAGWSRAKTPPQHLSLSADMKKQILLLCSLLVAGAAPAADRQFDPLPKPLSNNAVASLKEGTTEELFSFMGIGLEKK